MNAQRKEFWVGRNRIFLNEEGILNYINVGKIDEAIARESCTAMLKLRNIQGDDVLLIQVIYGVTKL